MSVSQNAGTTAADGVVATKPFHRASAAPMSLSESVREMLQAGDLFVLLLQRELQVRYKQTALGVVWVILQPLVPALIFAVVLGVFARLPSSGIPYLLFVMSGLVLYTLFAGIVLRAGNSLVRDGQLVTRVYFPRAVLPLASGTAALVDFFIGLAMLLALTLMMGFVPAVTALAIPLIVAATAIVGLAIGMAAAALMAHYRDFGHALPFVIQVLLYASPVVYSLELLPEGLTTIYALNPLVTLLDAFRWALFGTDAPSASHLVVGGVVGTVVVVLGTVVFARVTRDVADVI